VGETPVLKPGDWFEYTSGVNLPGGGPGSMKGELLLAVSAPLGPPKTSHGASSENRLSSSPSVTTFEVEVPALSLVPTHPLR